MPPETTNGNMSTTLSLEKVEDPSVLLPLLKERHPVSCLIYNQVIQCLNYGWKEEVKFYTIGKKINSDTWIICKFTREDWRCNYGISTPNDIVEGKTEIPEKIREYFISSAIINWDEMDDIVFLMTPKIIANMIYDVSVNVKGAITEVHPCYLNYMEIEDALKLDISTPDKGDVEIRRLDPNKNDAKFILDTWKYTSPGSEIEIPKCIKRNASGGVFLNGGKCVCGVYIASNGFLSGLYCLPEYREKGYAKLAMNYTFKEYAKDGCIPCLTVEHQNPGGIKFFSKLGLKVATVTYGVFIKKLILDK